MIESRPPVARPTNRGWIGSLLLAVCTIALAISADARADPAAAAKSASSSTARQSAREPERKEPKMEIATLGGGCFWCVEAVFEPLVGVEKVVSGYSGGRGSNPSYEQVSNGDTGHAEVVQVTFDPKVIPYRDVLEIFFAFHDPTTLNRLGGDVGTQYRSAIFTHSAGQQAEAGKVIADLTAKKVFGKPIVTEVTPFQAFYPAEDYHQEYFRNNANQPYCQVVIAPKVAKLRAKYASRLKKSEAGSS